MTSRKHGYGDVRQDYLIIDDNPSNGSMARDIDEVINSLGVTYQHNPLVINKLSTVEGGQTPLPGRFSWAPLELKGAPTKSSTVRLWGKVRLG